MEFQLLKWHLEEMKKKEAFSSMNRKVINNMNLLFKLTDKDFGIKSQEMKNYNIRLAARGIVIREDGKIAIQNKKNKNEYKLVGGGMEEHEDSQIAFQREVLEEAGCEIEIIQQLGITE